VPIVTIKIENDRYNGDVRLDLDENYQNEKRLIKNLTSGNIYEPDVSRVFLRVLREGDTAIDVGANVGFFTMLSAALVGPAGKVVSFEPDERNRSRLNANLALNSFNNVTLVENPASNKIEQVEFFINSDDSGGNALWDPGQFPGNTKSQANCHPLYMTTTTLDDALENDDAPPPKLIKVDTEGADQHVLEGGRQLLTGASVPFVIAELHEFGLEKMGCSQATFRGLMENLGYSTFALFYSGALPKLIPPKTRVHSKYFINLLFSTPDMVAEYWPDEMIAPD
jgi:FkbM family methyltransferase